MEKNKYDIFISYRRDGGSHYARILKAELEKRGYRDRVFLDYDELKDGRFDSRIMAAIKDAPVFIFILSPRSLDRCVLEDDWVRQEIVFALQNERHIIPINFDGLFTAFPTHLPTEVRDALGQHQFSKIDSESLLDVSIEKLIKERLYPLVKPREVVASPAIGAEIVVISDADCKIMRFNKILAYASANSEIMINLMKGNHLLEFVSTQCPEIKETIRFYIPDNDYTDFIEVFLKDRMLDKLTDEHLFRIKSLSGKWGFSDRNANMVVPCIYDNMEKYIDGLAKVQKGEKWGIIDKSGTEVIPCEYDYVESFFEGLAKVYKDGKCGFFDKKGNVVIPCKYNRNEIHELRNGMVRVEKNGKFGLLDTIDGQLRIPCHYKNAYALNDRLVVIDKGNIWEIVDRTGQLIIGEVQNSFIYFSEGMAAIKKDGKYGFINEIGDLLVPCIYEENNSSLSVEHFKEGLARVKKNGKWGVINKQGALVVPCKYEFIESYCNGFAQVVNGELSGFVDKTGKLAIPCIYDYGFNSYFFREGLAAVRKDGKWGLIDTEGNLVVNCVFDYVGHFNNGMAKVRKKGKEGLIDPDGNQILPCVYDWIYDISEGLFRVKKDGQFQFIDLSGKLVVSCPYDYAERYEHGLSIVVLENKQGLMDKSGTLLTPCVYDRIYEFEGSLVKVERDGKFGLIDKMGKLVSPCDKTGIAYLGEDLYGVGKNGLWGIIDKSGIFIVPFGKYESVIPFEEGIAMVNGGEKYIDKTGQVVIPIDGE